MPLDPSATLKNADKLLAEGKLAEALEQYVHAADDLYGEGFFPKASAIYKKALKVTPDHEHSLFRLYDIAVAQGMTLDAKTYMRELVRLRNRRSDIVGVAECLARLAKLRDGGAELRRTREMLGMAVGADPPSQSPPAPLPRPAAVVEDVRVVSTASEQAIDASTGDTTGASESELTDAAATVAIEAIEPPAMPVAPRQDGGPGSLETFFDARRSHAAKDRRALLYDLADALERRGEAGRALEIFTQVQADDDAYRDVAQRIERLRAMQQGTVQQGSSPA